MKSDKLTDIQNAIGVRHYNKMVGFSVKCQTCGKIFRTWNLWSLNCRWCQREEKVKDDSQD